MAAEAPQMPDDPIGDDVAMAMLEATGDLQAFVERSLGNLLRRSLQGRLSCPRLPDGVPDVRTFIDSIVRLINSRSGTFHQGVSVTKEVVVATMKRILLKRGHLEDVQETLLPNGWLQAASELMQTYLVAFPGHLGNPMLTYYFTQGIWVSYTGAGSWKSDRYRSRCAKRQREAGELTGMATVMLKFLDRIAPLQGNIPAELLPVPPAMVPVKIPIRVPVNGVVPIPARAPHPPAAIAGKKAPVAVAYGKVPVPPPA